jgi:hypothetical protein
VGAVRARRVVAHARGGRLARACAAGARVPSVVRRARRALSVVAAAGGRQHLSAAPQNLTKIEGLQHLPNLRELLLHQNAITKIEGLEGCPRLRRLWLFSNRLTRVESLHHAGDLRELWLQASHHRYEQYVVSRHRDKGLRELLAAGGWARDTVTVTRSASHQASSSYIARAITTQGPRACAWLQAGGRALLLLRVVSRAPAQARAVGARLDHGQSV